MGAEIPGVGSKTPGLGVMIAHLKGNEAAIQALSGAKGKKIVGIKIDHGDYEVTHELKILFDDETGIAIFDEGQSCCESRYMSADGENFSFFKDAVFLGAETKEGPAKGGGDDGHDDVHEIEFLVITTSKGELTISNHNEHNGYYGGFAMSARKLKPAEIPVFNKMPKAEERADENVA